MARTRVPLLALVLAFFLAGAGCGRKLPLHVWISDEFDDEEAEAILLGMDAWERATNLHIFVYHGRWYDQFNWEDLGDDAHVVYKLHDASYEYRYLSCHGNDDLAGYGTYGDVLIALDYWEAFRDEDPDGIVYGNGLEFTRNAFYLRLLRELATHELGHFIGLMHNPDKGAVMYPFDNDILFPTALDMEAFWSVYYYRRPPARR
ncbi:MAG: matrixin family metalloprotease [Patescibacteria group bacterium]